MTAQLSERIDELTRSRRAVRAGDGRARPGAELGARGRPRDRALRRHHRGLRRRPVRGRLGAHGRARTRSRPGWACCCGCCPTATTPSRRRRVPASWSTRACQEGRWRSTSSRCCRRRRSTSSGRRRPPRRWPTLAPTLGFVVDRAVEGATRRCDGRGDLDATAATSRRRSVRRSTPGVGFVGIVCSHTRGEALLEELDLTDGRARRVHPHVGLDIGARTAPEIALSILAEIVRRHPARGARGRPRPASRRRAPAPGGRPGVRHDRDVGPDTIARSRRRHRPLVLQPGLPRQLPVAATATLRDRRRRRAGRGRLAAPRAAQAGARRSTAPPSSTPP